MLVSMAARESNRPPVPPASPGAAIEARRKYLGMTQEQVTEITTPIISKKLWSQLENNHKSPGGLRLRQYRVLLDVLRYTPKEFEEVSGVAPMLAEPLPGAEPYRPSFPVPIAGTVSAGLAAMEMDVPYEGYLTVDPTVPALRGVMLENLVVLRVNGDSMVSEEAARQIASGSHVVVELGAIPRNGDLVVAWLEDRELAVLKQFEDGSDAVLRSFNPGGPAFYLGDEEIDIRGVVRMVQIYPSRG